MMMKQGRKRRALGMATILCGALWSSTSAAQDAPLSITPGPNGPQCSGASTIEGVTYTCEEVRAWLETTGGDTGQMSLAGIPVEIQAFIIRMRDTARAPAGPGGNGP